MAIIEAIFCLCVLNTKQFDTAYPTEDSFICSSTLQTQIHGSQVWERRYDFNATAIQVPMTISWIRVHFKRIELDPKWDQPAYLGTRIGKVIWFDQVNSWSFVPCHMICEEKMSISTYKKVSCLPSHLLDSRHYGVDVNSQRCDGVTQQLCC